MATATPALRYVTDVPYARRFVRELSPAWLDFSALICGAAPPARDDGFAWCKLGCGHGVTPAFLAALHPDGRFHGIDLLPDHITFAERFCRDAGIGNAAFHPMDFANAAELDLPPFDYIVAHGVYAWIDAAAQADLRRFIDRRLKPGGILYLSYDCLPGWAADMPLQHLLLGLAQRAEGDSIARLEAADRIVIGMMAAGADVLRQGAVGREWAELRAKLPSAYFVHQFLPPAWRPLYVTEVRQAMAELELAPVGSATIRENVDAFTLDRTARELLAAAPDADLRELMRDYLLMKRFRRDLFGRDVPVLDAEAVRHEIVGHRYMPAAASDAEPLPFNNPVAQRILALLADGPAAPARLLDEGHAIDAVVAEVVALAAGGRIWPVDAVADTAAIDRINAAVRARIGGPDEIAFKALPSGTAVELGAEQMQRLRKTGQPA